MPQTLHFWFEFASTYSYLSVMRIADAAEKRGVPVVWKPFLLGPIFAQSGWNTSPFNIYPAKGAYMWRDMARQCRKYGLPFQRPDPETGPPFPQNGLLAARIALTGLEQGWGEPFCKAVYTAQFAEGQDISEPVLLEALARKAGAHQDILHEATEPENKERLKHQVEEAISLGIFGAPSFAVGDELFWGNDRMEEALDWASR